MHTFQNFTDKVYRELHNLVQDRAEVYISDVNGDALWQTYLGAFPPGTDPLFKKRTEHDCSVCRSFIRRVGGMLVLSHGNIQTIWDGAAAWDDTYGTVAKALQAKLRASEIQDIFRVGLKETQFGAKVTRSVDERKVVSEWHHFYTVNLPSHLCVGLPDTARGQARTTFQVFERGMVGLSPEAVETVATLIKEKNLYRGEEHQHSVLEFQKLQRAYLALTKGHSRFLWANVHSSAARFKNTVIGTLVQDLSDGVDIDTAVRSFEAKVAPTNYKRTTAIITPMMVKKAMETITELGLEPALERRFANITDVSVEDVLWVNGNVRPQPRSPQNG